MTRLYISAALILAFSNIYSQSITITLETTSVVTSPLTPGATAQNIFGFQLAKSTGGTGQVTDLVINLSQNPTGIFTNPQIWFSTDNTLTGADTPTAGSFAGSTAVFTGAPLTSFGGSSGAISRWFFLTVDVASTATGTEQPSISDTGVTSDITVNAATITGTNFSFLTTTIGSLNAGPNNVAASPLVAGTNGKAIFGFSLTSGGTQTVTLLDFAVTSTPTAKLAAFSLVRSTDADFATGGDNTTIAGLTFSTTTSLIRITAGLSESITTTSKNYFLVANVDPAATGATAALQVSLPAANVTAGTGTVNGSATGTNYSFAALTTTIASLNVGANNVAASPLTSGSTGKAVFGFSLTSNGSQTVTLLDFAVTSDPTGKLATYSLVRSTDADFATGGDNTTIGGLTFITTPALVRITAGLSESITTTAKNYFLVANVDPAVTGATAALQVSLPAANVTAGTGTVTGTATGTNYSFAALTTTIASLNAGANNVAASPLLAGSTGKAVFGFSLTSNGSQTVTLLDFPVTTDPTGKLATYSLVRSVDTDFATAGDNTTIGGLTISATATLIRITAGLTESITTTAKNYFLVANVDPAVTGATATEQVSLGSANVTVGSGIVSGSSAGIIYSFVPITLTIGSLNTGANNVAASPLIGGATGNAVFGFSLTSNSTQTVTLLDFPVTTDPSGKLATYSLVRSVDTDFATAGDNTTIGGLTIGATATLIRITAGLSESITTTAKNYFLVANVDPTVTGVTASIQVSLGLANVTASTGVVAGSATGTNYSFTPLTTTIASLNVGANNVAASPLVAGATGKAIFGFSLTSNGSQTVTLLDFPVTSDPAGKLATYSLVRSVDTDFATGGDNTTIGGLTIGATATLIRITAGLSESITTTAKNYFLVANVDPAVTGVTASIQVSLGLANVTASTGVVAGSATGTNYSFTPLTTTIASLNAGANNVAASPLIAGATGKAIFGFSLTSNGSQTVTLLDFPVTSDPAGKLATYSLVRSVDTDFATGGDNTTIAGLTITSTTSLIQITAGLSEGISSTTKNYFLVANVDPAVTGVTATEQVSLGNTNVTVGSGVVSGSSTGTNYSFIGRTITIASLNAGANNVALSPLVAGANGKSVFGFSLTSNLSQTVTLIDFPVTSDPTGKLATFSLVRSADADFATGGDNTTIAGLTFSTTATLIRITAGLTESITTTANNYFLIANVDPAVTGATASEQVSLGNSNVTASSGTVSGSATGTNYSFVPITTTIASLNAGANNVATSPLIGSATGKAVFGFSLTSNASQTVTLLNFPVTSDPAGKLLTYSLVRSTDADFATGGDNTTIGGLTISATATQIQITAGLSESITTTAKNYFLVANVDPAVTGVTASIQVSLGLANVTASTGVVAGSATGTNYSFQGLTLTLASLSTGLAASPLAAGTNGNAILGFSLTSNLTQTVTLLDFPVTSDPTGKLGTYSLVRSTDNSFSTSGDNTTIGGLTFGTTPSLIQITAGLSEVINTSAKNYFLVANVNGGVNSTTTALQPSLTQANVTVSPGSVATNTITGTNYSFISSQTSTIVNNAFVGQTSLDYSEYNMQSSSGLTTANSQKIFSFDIKDGDIDNQSTTINSLTLQFNAAGAANLNAITLIDNGTSTPIANSELSVSSSIDGFDRIAFSTISIPVSDGSIGTPTVKRIDVYVTFNATVIDNVQIPVSVFAAAAIASGSGLAALGTVQTTAGKNPINVVATEMQYSGISPTINPSPATFGLTVSAIDANGNVDLNKSSNVTLSKQAGSGTLSSTDAGGLTRAFVAGVVSWAQLKLTLAGAYTLRATDAGGLPNKDQAITVASLGVILTAANATLCPVGSGAFFTTLPNLVITESDPADFSAGSNLTYLLFLPNGFEFDPTNIVTPAFTAAKNITAMSAVSYIGKTVAKFTYSVNAIDQFPDQITISGLKVKNVNASAPDVILRSGTGLMDGNDETKVQGTLTPGGSAVANFTVQASPNQTPITPTETNFSVSSAPIILNGEVPPGTPAPGTISFTGQGISYKFIGAPISANRYTFNPATLDAGNYDIVFTHTDLGTGCISTKTKTFNVFSSGINGLLNQYCSNDNTVQSLSPNAAFIPAGYTFVNYSIQFPSYKYINNVVNNGTSLTVTVPNHGLQAGNSYLMYIDGGFFGTAINNGTLLSPYGSYIYGTYTVSNVTANTFDIVFSSGTLSGSWFGYGYFYFTQPVITNVVNLGTSLQVTAASHGLQNGAKIYISINGLSIDVITPSFYGWYTVSNVTANTFDITVTATGAWTSAYMDIFTYEISSFTPNMAPTLNSNLASQTFYYVGFFLRSSPCTTWQNCVEFINYSQQIRLNPLPGVDFTGLNSSYCVNNNSPVILNGNQPDGTFTASPNFGLTDGGANNPSATFLASAIGITPETPINITYTFTDGNNCTNSVIKSTTVHALPIVLAGADAPICNGSSIIIGGAPTASGNGPFGYNWTNPGTLDNPFIPNPKASPVSNTTYAVSVTDTYGCTANDNLVITVNSPATVDAGISSPICSGTGVFLDITTIGANYSGSASSATWSTAGDGFFKDAGGAVNVNFGTAVKYFPGTTDLGSGGTVLTLTTDDPIGPCPAVSDVVPFTINGLATVNPGLNLEACSDAPSVALNGSFGGSATAASWSSSGLGGLAGTTLPIDTYTPSVSERTNGATITMTLTSNDPDGGGPCSAISANISLKIWKKPTIDAGPDQILCVNSPPPVFLTGTIINTSAGAGIWTGGGGTFSSGSLIANYTPAGSDIPAVSPNVFATVIPLTLTSDDPTSGVCGPGVDQITLTIYPLPAAPTTPILNFEYCANDLIAPLSASSAIGGSTINWYTSPPPGVPAFTGNSYATGTSPTIDQLNTYYATQVAFASASPVFAGCESPPTTLTIRVNPLPFPNFNAKKFCFNDFMELRDSSTLSTATKIRSIVNWQWDFSDNDLIGGTGAIPAGTNGGRTNGTYQYPFHKYQFVGINYNVQLTVTSNDLRTSNGLGCSNSVLANNITTNPLYAGFLQVGSLPLPDFKINNICDTDVTQFTYIPNSTPGAVTISSYNWDLGDASTSTVTNPTHQYITGIGYGNYPVTLVVNTNLNCTATVNKALHILPYLKTFPAGGYVEDFDGASTWFAEALNSAPNNTNSWQLATIGERIITSVYSGSKAWITNAKPSGTPPYGTYYDNERSVLNGPCFDMTSSTLLRPVLSFKYWDATDGTDGTYLEISTDGGQNKNSYPADPAGSWSKLGAVNTGLGWYDSNSILGLSPSNNVGQQTVQEGWSGIGTGWQDGKFNLDLFKSGNKVRIRFVFGSNSDNTAPIRDGFAIDHFSMQNRNRTLLAENFTNKTADVGQTNSNNFYNFKNSASTNELLKIEYHFGMGGVDPYYDADKADADARAGFYGVARTNANVDAFQGFISGSSGGKFPASGGWSQAAYDLQSLVTSPLDISIATPAAPADLFNVKATITTNQDLPPGQYVIQIAVIEDTVGTSRYIIRKMLPDASGTPLTALTASTNQTTPVYSWNMSNVTDPSQLRVIVFVQDLLEADKKFVVQAKYEGNPTLPPTVTSIDRPSAFETIAIYPNPSNKEFTIQLPTPARQEITLKLWDQVGKLVHESFIPAGANSKTVGTQDFAAGVYILQMDSGSKGDILRKKVMVVHGN